MPIKSWRSRRLSMKSRSNKISSLRSWACL
jgi:hypothetical protein